MPIDLPRTVMVPFLRCSKHTAGHSAVQTAGQWGGHGTLHGMLPAGHSVITLPESHDVNYTALNCSQLLVRHSIAGCACKTCRQVCNMAPGQCYARPFSRTHLGHDASMHSTALSRQKANCTPLPKVLSMQDVQLLPPKLPLWQ